ncbi:protein ORF128 [Cyprinid herpesvirus 1]|uniref:Protein ORF128 n=1 Tax=Cyprinid herpesvirus 1 TaxID=317858 RepID=K7PC97_9VIRU|nr:protein ORF128 [Cyprinid herpesvirus 1]AFJ20417.1 protein ORF128 [Cyprinid herpesvirus 1]
MDVTSLKIELVCTECGDLLEDPVTVACGHTFCRDCLIVPTCGICLSDINPEAFQWAPNATLTRFLEILKTAESENSTPQITALITPNSSESDDWDSEDDPFPSPPPPPPHASTSARSGCPVPPPRPAVLPVPSFVLRGSGRMARRNALVPTPENSPPPSPSPSTSISQANSVVSTSPEVLLAKSLYRSIPKSRGKHHNEKTSLNRLHRVVSELESKERWHNKMLRERYLVRCNLDPATAHPKLRVDMDGRICYFSEDQTSGNGSRPKLSFTSMPGVMSQMGRFGPFYAEMSVDCKRSWIFGVCSSGVNKNMVIPKPSDGAWTLSLKEDGTLWANTDFRVQLPNSVHPLSKVGVLVNQEMGSVQFIDPQSNETIFTFNRQTQLEYTPIHMFASPGKKDSVPIIVTEPVPPKKLHCTQY